MEGNTNNYDELARQFKMGCATQPGIFTTIQRFRGMSLNTLFLRNAIQNTMDDTDPAATWYRVNYAVQIVCNGFHLEIPVQKRGWTPQTPPVDAVSGPDAAGLNPLELPPGPGLAARFHLLSDRVARIHAFVLSER